MVAHDLEVENAEQDQEIDDYVSTGTGKENLKPEKWVLVKYMSKRTLTYFVFLIIDDCGDGVFKVKHATQTDG